MSSVPRWFRGVKMNFAQNILFTGDKSGKPTDLGKEDDKIACTAIREGCKVIKHVSWQQLREKVGRLSQAMRAHGVGKGDRIALVSSVCVDTLVVFLATATVGAIFSSSSTDMGTRGILDRLRQIKPKFIFMEDWAVYRSRKIDLRPKMNEIVQGMSDIADFQGLVVQARFQTVDTVTTQKCQSWADYLKAAPSSDLIFTQLDFSDPMIIVYSSGTTGQPKCIVHTVGGVVLSGHKESTLHRAVTSASTQLQFTTTGWMMYMSSVQLLLMGARTVMYDGSPFEPDLTTFIRMVGEQKVTHLGISPRFLQTFKMNGIIPMEVAQLDHLHMVTSTGMVLSEALFEWFYETFPKSVHLANISGGTDIAAAFGTANPLLPVYSGGCQCIALGMAVAAVTEDENDPSKNRPAKAGEPGELVCTKAFPTMPHSFYGSKGKEQYINSYFGKYFETWYHGDLIMFHPKTNHVIFLGRADGVLNPSGVRFGSAEIYNIVDDFFADTISDSLCVGQRRPSDDDESVMLFVLMKSGQRLTRKLTQELKSVIRRELSPRHVPRYVFETPEIPVSRLLTSQRLI
jgi:acetoacetyl-CoA synthetase